MDTKTFLNIDEFAEKVDYNGKEITATFEERQNLGKDEYGGRTALATVYIAVNDIANPEYQDKITRGNVQEWTVQKILSTDAGMYALEVTRDERGRWR